MFQPDEQNGNIRGTDTGDSAGLTNGQGANFCQFLPCLQAQTGDGDMGFTPVVADDTDFAEETVADSLEGFGLEDENGDAITDDVDTDDFGFDDEDDN